MFSKEKLNDLKVEKSKKGKILKEIDEIIKKEVIKEKLDDSKNEEIKQILKFLTNKNQNISSILGTSGVGKTSAINTAINICQKNKKYKKLLKNKPFKKIVKIDLWRLFGLKSKMDYCENCLPSTGVKLLDEDKNLNFYSYAKHQCNTSLCTECKSKNKTIDNEVITSLCIKKNYELQ